MDHHKDDAKDDIKQSIELQSDETSTAFQPLFTPRPNIHHSINQLTSSHARASFFDSLPDDLITSVFDYLATLSLLRLTARPVSKSFGRLSQQYSSFDVDLDREITDDSLVIRSLQQSKDQYAPVIEAAGKFHQLNSLVLNSFGSLLTDQQVQPLLDRHADSLMNVSLAGNNLTCPVVRSPHLLTLDLSKNRRLTSPSFNCPALVELDLSRTFINDYDLSHSFACAPRLRVLRLRACKNITTLPLSLPYVQIVDLSFTAIIDVAIARLTEGSTSLNVLFLNECSQLRSPTIHSESLTVLSCKTCELLRAPSLECPSLTELDLSQTNITDQALAHAISRSSKLQVLGLRHCHGLDAPELINDLPSLTSLDLYTSSISTRGCIGFLETCPNLIALQLTLCEGLMPPFIEQSYDIDQRQWMKLSQLCVKSTHLDDADLRSIVLMAPNMQQITAGNCVSITGAGLSSNSLTHIDLAACEVTDAILKDLFANCPSLFSACFNHCNLLRNPIISHDNLQVLHLDYVRSMDIVNLKCPELHVLYIEANLNLTSVVFDGDHHQLHDVYAKHVNQLVLNGIVYQLADTLVNIHGNAPAAGVEEVAYKPSRTAPFFRSIAVPVRRSVEPHLRTTALGTSPSSSHHIQTSPSVGTTGINNRIRSSPRTTSRRLSNSHSRDNTEPNSGSPGASPAHPQPTQSSNHQRHSSSTTISPSSVDSLLRRTRISNTAIHSSDHIDPNSPNRIHAGSHPYSDQILTATQPSLTRSRSASHLLSLPGSAILRSSIPRPSTANTESATSALTALLQARKAQRAAAAADVLVVSQHDNDTQSKYPRLERAASLSEVDNLPRFCLNSIEIYIIQSHIADIEEKLADHNRALAASRARNGPAVSQNVQSLILSQAMHYGLKRQLALLKAKLKKELRAVEAEMTTEADDTNTALQL